MAWAACPRCGAVKQWHARRGRTLAAQRCDACGYRRLVQAEWFRDDTTEPAGAYRLPHSKRLPPTL